MLTAHPKKWYSWDYSLLDADGQHLADLGLSSWRDRGTFVLGGAEYRARREGLGGPFLLEHDGAVRARARKTRFFGCEFEIEFEGDHYTLTKPSIWSHTVVLHQGGEELGVIRHAAWYKRDAHIEMAERLSPVLQAFALWLALLLWKREAAAAEGA
ncbi:MAG TPA: hypothetical protein VN524_03255 [Hyphomicrobiaceae bacterium]|nr:hypothetical protein [Hyphomicrobiaceae bacterium]